MNYLIALGVMMSLYTVLDLFFNIDEFTEAGEPITTVAANVSSYYAAHCFLYFAQLSGVITLFIIFKGSQRLVAFGISFVPALLVIVSIVMGRQMSQNAGPHVAGLMLIWGGIVLVALLDVWLLLRVLRR